MIQSGPNSTPTSGAHGEEGELDVRAAVNYMVGDTKAWEQQAAQILDPHPAVEAFVKNSGLGFAIPYLHSGQGHEYLPDFIIRIAGAPDSYLILETNGFDDLAEVKAAAAERWVAAVNADGPFGTWRYTMAWSVPQVRECLDVARVAEARG